MTSGPILAVISACVSGALAFTVAAKRNRSLAHWSFSAGMLVFAAINVIYAFELGTSEPATIIAWQNAEWVALSLLPGPWLLFSLTYARGNYRDFLKKWNFVLAIAFLAPVTLSIVFWDLTITTIGQDDMNHPLKLLRMAASGYILNFLLLSAALLVLINLERTYRAAVGTMRWRIKFMALGLGVIFAVEAYTRHPDQPAVPRDRPVLAHRQLLRAHRRLRAHRSHLDAGRPF